MVNQTLKDLAYLNIGSKVSTRLFEDFHNPNHRVAIALTCLQEGYPDVALDIFLSVVQEGPKKHPDHHFAYIRSCVETAELKASEGIFEVAEKLLEEALVFFPKKMSYMLSRVHLEVYLSYYRFQLGKKEMAYTGIRKICRKEKDRFYSLPKKDAYDIVAPGLCYALHQWALFCCEDGEWGMAVDKMKEMRLYSYSKDDRNIDEAKRYEESGAYEQAFFLYEKSISY